MGACRYAAVRDERVAAKLVVDAVASGTDKGASTAAE